MFIKKVDADLQSKQNQMIVAIISGAMVLILTAFSLIFIALIADIVQVDNFTSFLGLSKSQAAAANLVILRIRELTFGAIAIFSKIFSI